MTAQHSRTKQRAPLTREAGQANETKRSELHAILNGLDQNRVLSSRLVLTRAFKAWRLARELNLDDELGYAYVYIAAATRDLGRHRHSMTALQKAVPLVEHSTNRQVKIKLHNLQGILAQESGDRSAAYTHYHAALLMARDLGDLRLQAVILGNLSLAAHSLGDISNAMSWSLEGLTLARQSQQRDTAARILLNNVSMTRNLERFDQALKDAQQGYELSVQAKAPSLINLALLMLAQAHLDLSEVVLP